MAAGFAVPIGSALADRVGIVANQILANNHIPGMAVAVTYNGQVVLAEGYGVRDASTGAPVEPDTTFGLGSVTKTFTALATLLIYDNPSLIKKPGITSLGLDVPISTYLTDNAEFKLPESWDGMTTRQLLQMSAGMPDIGNGKPWYVQIDEAGAEGLDFAPGTAYLYSNASYFVLGALIQQLTATPYEQFLQEQVLDPLGLDDTVLLEEGISVVGQAVGYQEYDPGTGTWTLPSPGEPTPASYFSAGALASSAVDLGKYMSALWGRKLLSETAYGLMWSPTPLPSFNYPGRIPTPGLGWCDGDGVVVVPGGIIVNKDGAVPGYSSLVTMDFASGFGVAITFNLTTMKDVHPVPSVHSYVDAIMAAASTGGIGGTVYSDLDGGGAFNPADSPLAGWQVYLDANNNGQFDGGEVSTATNAQGAYFFDRVAPGTAVVRVVPAAGWWPIAPEGGVRVVEVGPSEVLSGRDFGFGRPAEVTGVERVGRGPNARIVLTFNEGLDPATAGDPRNYGIVLPGLPRRGGVRPDYALPISKATYDASSRTVTLTTRFAGFLGRKLAVQVRNDSVRSTAGLFLDGNDDGRPGGAFAATLGPRARGAAWRRR